MQWFVGSGGAGGLDKFSTGWVFKLLFLLYGIGGRGYAKYLLG
jgi:hypothetical protein